MERPSQPDAALRIFGASPERRLALLRAAWPAAVGPEVARRAEVVALDGALLRVRVPDAGWQRQLLRMRGEILARLRRIAGDLAPHALGFVEGPVSAPPEPPPPALPAPAFLAPELVAAAESIPDPEVRARFLATAGRYLGRFRADEPAEDGGKGSG